MIACSGRACIRLFALSIFFISIAVAKPQAEPSRPFVPAADRQLVAAATAKQRIAVNPLASVSIDSVGAISAQEGALPPTMWRDTQWTVVDSLLARLPVTTPSPAMRSLMRRLLLSPAAPPAGLNENGRLLDERAWQLWRMGDSSDLLRLIAAVPAEDRIARLIYLDTEARLLTGDFDTACNTAVSQYDDDDIFWDKVLGFCQTLRGETDNATLTLALLSEGDNDLGAYPALITAIRETAAGSSPAAIDLPAPLTPLDLAMLRAARLSPAPAIANVDDLSILTAVARSDGFADPLRVAAGERAVVAGVMPAGEIYPLLARNPASDAVPAAGEAHAGTPMPSSADIFQAALVTATDVGSGEESSRAELAARALQAGRQSGRWLIAVRAVAPWITSADYPVQHPDLALQLVPAMLVLGDRGNASLWLDALARQARTSPEAAATLATLLPLAHLARLPQAQNWNAKMLAGWWEAQRDLPDAAARAKRLLTMLQAAGDNVPNTLWRELPPDSTQAVAPGIDAVYRTQLQEAARAGRVGETALLVLVACGMHGPETLNTSSMETVVDSLRAVGLVADARAFALEAVAAQ